jgi:chromosome partitioning protein
MVIKNFLARLSAIFRKKSSSVAETIVGSELEQANTGELKEVTLDKKHDDVSRETLSNTGPEEAPGIETRSELSDGMAEHSNEPVPLEAPFGTIGVEAVYDDADAAAEGSSAEAALDNTSPVDELREASLRMVLLEDTSAEACDMAALDEENNEAARKPLILDSRVLVVINQKGGVGKTTTAINLSAALAEMGQRVLLVDADPQGNAGSGLGIDRNKLGCCLYDLLLGTLSLADVRVETMIQGLDVVPATVNLAGAEVELVVIDNREYRLGEVLKDAVNSYDFVIIDCPPSLGLLTINALAIADEAVIPVQCEFFALEGLSQLYSTLGMIRKELNPRLRQQHILINMYDGRVKLHQQIRAEIEKFFQADLFKTEIPRSGRLSEAPSFGQPIMEYDKSGRLSDIYRRLAEEVVGFE